MSSVKTVASLFSGIGGLDLGFANAGFDVCWATDINKAAVDSYRLNFGLQAVQADITTFPVSDIPDTDVIVGGPPCQSFSLVGQRRAEDARGQLVFRFAEIIKQKRPRAFVMENVPGLAASRVNGKRLTNVLAEYFRDEGYRVTVAALNAHEFLVPQKRRRVFLIGCLDRTVTEPSPDAFARECYSFEKNSFDVGALAAIGDLGDPVDRDELADYRGDVNPSVFAHIMRKKSRPQVDLHEKPRMSSTDIAIVRCLPPGGNYRDIPDSIATPRIRRIKSTGGRTTTYARLHPAQPSYTVNTYFRRPNVGSNFHYHQDRLITPREAMRFQAIPDRFTIQATCKQTKNTLIGNAVPSLLAEAVAWALASAFTRGSRGVARQKEMF